MDVYERQKYVKEMIKIIKDYKQQGCYTCYISEGDESGFDFNYVNREKNVYYIKYILSQTRDVIEIYKRGIEKPIGDISFNLGSKPDAICIFYCIDDFIRINENIKNIKE